MKTTSFFASLFFLFLFLPGGPWKKSPAAGYDVFYQKPDRAMAKTLRPVFAAANDSVAAFFGQNFPRPFAIYIHPDRASMDAQWQHDWQMPDFKSECWMVASGVGARLDLLSPRQWATQACEHDWARQEASRRLITHELVHVYHGQRNPSPDFSDVQGLDWLVEGLAAYASGQCDEARLAPVRAAVRDGKAPATLDKFWSGPLRYGLSGSVVAWIDHRYGRQTLIDLLPLTRKQAALDRLGVSEAQLLKDWQEYVVAGK
ncbi:MAG: hypothetical protein IT259_20400 [Saprospiraceae bacterium]|nr:hypothetical protein [Saprospiraceae bacterium]